MATEINHDPYARQSLMRTKCSQFQSCTWCGSRARWKYGIQSDDSLRGYIDWSKGQYCSIGCYRAWNG